MLNPFASDFKPFTPELETSKPIPQKPESQAKKKTPTKKSSAPQSTKPKKPNVKADTQTNAESSNSSNRKKKELLSSSNKKGTSQDPKSRNRRKSSQKDIAITAPSLIVEDQFAKESPFIAIEAAIDPIHRLDTRVLPVNVNYSRRTSSAQEPRFEHGYERYIDWVMIKLRFAYLVN